MGTSSSTCEGTPGTFPSPLGAGYGTFTVAGTPSSTSTYLDYSNTQAKAGSTSWRFNNLTQGGVSLCTTVQTNTYFRAYCFLTAAPSYHFMLFGLLANGYTKSTQIGISTDRKVWASAGKSDLFSYETGPYNAASGANAVPLNSWFRMEGLIVGGSNTVATVKLWTTDPESTGTPDYTGNTGASGVSLTADDVRIGAQAFNGGWLTFLPSSHHLYLDDVAVSDVNYIGPSGSSGGGSGARGRGFGIVRY